MSLPSIGLPEFFLELPSNNNEIKYRPFSVKEQKILLMAKESKEPKEIVNAVETIVKSCTDLKDVSKLPYFDIEFIFLHIRGKSMGEDLEFRLRHGENKECKHVTETSVSIDDIKISIPEGKKTTIELQNNIGITVQYPNLHNIDDFAKSLTAPNRFLEFVYDNVENVFDQEKVYDDFTRDEMVTFIDSLDSMCFEKIQKWYNEMPLLTHNIKWTCPKCGEEDSVTLTGLNDFFL